MSSLIRKLGHAGKSAVKFMYTARLHSLSQVPDDCGMVSVVWTRGPRQQTFKGRFPLSGENMVKWEEEQAMVVTLYRKGTKGFDKKEAKFTVKEERGSKSKKVGSVTIDLSQYATMDGTPITAEIPLDENHKNGPALKITFTSAFLKNYTGVDDDVASQMTDMTDMSRLSGAHSETSEQNLDDFPELDDDLHVAQHSSNSNNRKNSLGASSGGGGGGSGSGAAFTAANIAAVAAAASSSKPPTNIAIPIPATDKSAEPSPPMAAAAAPGAGAAKPPIQRRMSGSSNDQLAKLTKENAELRSQVAQLLSSTNSPARGGGAGAGGAADENSARKIRELEEEVEELQSRLDKGEGEWHKTQQELQRMHDQNSNLQGEIEELQERIESSKESGSAESGKVRTLQAEIERLKEENKTLEDVVEPLQEENDALISDKKALKAENTTLLSKIDQLQKQLQGGDKDKIILTLRGEVETLQTEKTQLDMRCHDLEQEVATLKDNMADLQSTSSTLAAELNTVRGRSVSIDKESKTLVPELKAKVRALEADLAKYKQSATALDEVTEALISAKLQLAEVTGENYILENKVTTLKKDVEKYKNQASKLGEQVANLEVKYESEKAAATKR
eukprot:comp22116_c1_seq2/m.51530 comp22116_c1_seq2/g.51530  ORF comp22116_c1_seq2/g.51530 comp22116_c1_seq2/m.51530 type:complete len:618 (+) comp22116_c1_seq2:125-1978(+)